MLPLVFTPFLRPAIWGGRRLGDLLGKPLSATGSWGESWEVSAHPAHVSRVLDGPFAGCSLTGLCHDHGSDLFGAETPDSFPWLVKYLDADDWLSIQVHPDDGRAPILAGEPRGKTEAWVVLAATPGSRILAGLEPGVERGLFERALVEGRLVECLHVLEPAPGDCLFLPAGTVHAVGGGVLLAEVQQSSDATLRLHDWGRVDRDGKPRALHVAEGLEAIDWDAGPVRPVEGRSLGPDHDRLVTCGHFHLDRVRVEGSWESPFEDRLSIWLLIEGQARLHARDGQARSLERGATVLVPASAREVCWEGRSACTLLAVTLP